MRHGKKIAHLGRKTPHRKYMLANMACSLIEHKSINTTVAKAKALKKYIEPLITKSKSDSTHNRRIVFSYLKNKYAVTELFRDISVKIGDRPGGYTRIIKLGNRLGDNASMAMIELVDYNTIYNSGTDSAKKTRRRKKSSKKSNVIVEESPAPVVEESAAPVVEESAVRLLKNQLLRLLKNQLLQLLKNQRLQLLKNQRLRVLKNQLMKLKIMKQIN